MSKKDVVNDVFLYRRGDEGAVRVDQGENQNNDKKDDKNSMNDSSQENISEYESEYEYDLSAWKAQAEDRLLNMSARQLPRMKIYKESKKRKRYADEFKEYILDNLNLDCKKEFVDGLFYTKPYQRCFLFFNDNRKYRQLHELYKVMRDSIRAGDNKKPVNALANNVEYATSLEFCKFVRDQRSFGENGIVTGNNQQLRIMRLSEMHKRYFNKAKEIANRIVSSCCLDCTAEPQVIE